jgi:ATP-dependent helicase/nuclease subunit B
LVGGEGEERLKWLEAARRLDLALRGPRPRTGIEGLDEWFAEKGSDRTWHLVRPAAAKLARGLGAGSLADLAASLREMAGQLAGDAAWRGPDGRLAAELLAELEQSPDALKIAIAPDDVVPLLRTLMEGMAVRRPYGGHPRIFIWGLLEARLQKADLMILGGMNEGVWPASPNPDPWLAPPIRRTLGLPGLQFRIGLAAHDFVGALGAPRVLLTRARRDSRSPTIASRLWLRLQAMTGGMTRDQRLERLALAIDASDAVESAPRPAPAPPRDQRPREIWVTQVDRLNADPFAFYASAMLKLKQLEPVDADHSAQWKGMAVHTVLEQWMKEDECDPDRLLARARNLVEGEAIHPMLRALWKPRLLEAIDWIADQERSNRAEDRHPLTAEAEGKAEIGGVIVHGRADRIDRMADGRLAIIDYKTGQPPRSKAVEAGFALQLGLLGLIARADGFDGIKGEPGSHEYWSLAKDKDRFGKKYCPDAKAGSEAFLAHSLAHLTEAIAKWLTGEEPFTAKLNPAYAPYGEYDQLMRLEEWYSRD